MSEEKAKRPVDLKTVLVVMAWFGLGSLGSLAVFAKKLAWFAVKDEVISRDSTMMAERKRLVREQRDVNSAVMWQLVLLEEVAKHADPKAYNKARKDMEKWKSLKPSLSISTERSGALPPSREPYLRGPQPTMLSRSDTLSLPLQLSQYGRGWLWAMP